VRALKVCQLYLYHGLVIGASGNLPPGFPGEHGRNPDDLLLADVRTSSIAKGEG